MYVGNRFEFKFNRFFEGMNNDNVCEGLNKNERKPQLFDLRMRIALRSLLMRHKTTLAID
jgi:hypothetical protein